MQGAVTLRPKSEISAIVPVAAARDHLQGLWVGELILPIESVQEGDIELRLEPVLAAQVLEGQGQHVVPFLV